MISINIDVSGIDDALDGVLASMSERALSDANKMMASEVEKAARDYHKKFEEVVGEETPSSSIYGSGRDFIGLRNEIASSWYITDTGADGVTITNVHPLYALKSNVTQSGGALLDEESLADTAATALAEHLLS